MAIPLEFKMAPRLYMSHVLRLHDVVLN